MDPPHFGEGALRLEGSRLQKSLRPEIFSTPLLPLAWEESMGGVSGQFAHAQPSVLPTPHSQVGGTGSRPRVRTGSPKIKSSEQGVTQNEEMRQVGPQPLEVWSHHPRATRESGHPWAGTESPTPALALPELGWVRGPQALPWAGGFVDGGVALQLGSRIAWGLLPVAEAEDLPVHPAEAGFSFR